MSRRVSLYIADGDHLLRETYKNLLASAPDIEVVGNSDGQGVEGIGPSSISCRAKLSVSLQRHIYCPGENSCSVGESGEGALKEVNRDDREEQEE